MKAIWLVWTLVLGMVCGCETGGARELVSIEVSLENAAISAPAETQATAIGTYNDGVETDITAEVTWSSSNAGIGDVGPAGAVTAVSSGRASIRATLDDVTGEAELSVLEPQLEMITITGPSQFVPNGMFLQLAATGHYNNGTMRVLTSAVAWSVTSTTIATIDSAGRLAAHSVGGTTVQATQGLITGTYSVSVTAGVLVTLTIAPNPVPVLPKGLTVELSAMGMFSDGVENDVTDMVVWAADNGLVATVNSTDNKGLVTATGTTGATNIYATYNAPSGTITDTMTVSAAPAVIVRVEIDPATLMVPLGSSENLECAAIYSDATEMGVTNLATWDSADDAIVTVDDTIAKGLVTANDTTLATTQVTCTYLTFDDEIDVTTIAAVIESIDVSPDNPDVLVNGADVQFTAERVMSNGTRVATTCTWDAGTATISASGLLEADSVAAGAGEIDWTCDGFTGTATYTAFEATALALVIEDTEGTTPPVGATLAHRAMAQTSGPAFDVTAIASWESLDATIDEESTPGEFTTVSAGPGTIRATFDGHAATRSVTVL
ncbi:MAG: Ig-like domain-containing protein [Kofleriaceae bacterium]